MAADDLPPQRKPRGPGKRFKRGQSGNPKGPTPGQRHSVFAALDAIGQEGAEAAVRAVVTAAAGGDMRAAEILLRRVWPERKGCPLPFALPTAAGGAGVAEAMGSVIAAMAAGTMTPEEAGAVAGVIEVHRKTLELVDVQARLAALEEKEGKP